MTEAVIALTKDQWHFIQELKARAQETIRTNMPSRQVLFLGGLLAILQLLDGLLTSQGVHHFGVNAEGNPLLRGLMLSLGYESALIAAKAISLVIIVALCFLASRVSWLVHAMRVVIFIYLGFAIIPWSVILLKHVYLG